MTLAWTLSRYIGRRFLVTVLAAFAICLAVIFLIDMVELVRRTATKPDVTFGTVLAMTLFHLPGLGGETLPFAVLLGAIACFMRLSRTQELVIARAAGLSVWQFLGPAIGVAFLVGVAAVTVYNPVAATMSAKFEELEARYIRGHASLLAVSSSGFWLRQADADGQSVVHALRVSDQGLALYDVVIFLYDNDNHFLGRIDAERAELGRGYWLLANVWLTQKDNPTAHHATYRQPTSLTAEQVQENFAAPESISFWDLPGFINVAESAGFSALRYRLYWHSLIAGPVLLCAMVLVAAAFSLRLARFGRLGVLLLGGVMAGFLLYFLGNLSLALGVSGIIPPILAAWAPTIIALLLGLATLFHQEDG